MVKFINRCKVQVASGGTGTLTFAGGSVASFESLADQSVVDADQLRYTLEQGNEYEVGTGVIGLSGSTYTMTRTPLRSSNSDNSAINAGASAVCFFTMLADDVTQYLADLANVSDTSPSGGQALTWDASASTWKPASPSGGIVNVSTYANLPGSPSVTDLAFVTDTKALYIFDGTEWDRVSTGSQFAPRLTTAPPATLALESDGTTSTLTVVAVDDVGFPISYDWDAFDASNTVYKAGTLPNMLTAVTENSGVFTLTPSTNGSHGGNLTFRSKASDGVATLVGLTTLTLEFTTAIAIDTGGNTSTNVFTANSNSGLASYSGNTNSTSANNMAYSPLAKLKGGKKYIEFKMTNAGTSTGIFGVGDLTTAAAGTLGYQDTALLSVTYLSNGKLYPNLSSSRYIASGAATVVTNDILMIAWDTTAKKVWWGKNGTWGSGTGDPTSALGESLANVNFTTGLTFVFGQAVNTTFTGQFISGTGQTLSYSVPSGFEAY